MDWTATAASDAGHPTDLRRNGRLMQFRYHPEPELPPLAWACRYQPGSARVDVHCGAMVETRGDFFVEGAWDGSIASGPSADSNLTGSGGRIAGAGLEIYQPFHTFQRLHLWRGADQLWLSNSLAYCLARYRTAARQPVDNGRLQRAAAHD